MSEREASQVESVAGPRGPRGGTAEALSAIGPLGGVSNNPLGDSSNTGSGGAWKSPSGYAGCRVHRRDGFRYDVQPAHSAAHAAACVSRVLLYQPLLCEMWDPGFVVNRYRSVAEERLLLSVQCLSSLDRRHRPAATLVAQATREIRAAIAARDADVCAYFLTRRTEQAARDIAHSAATPAPSAPSRRPPGQLTLEQAFGLPPHRDPVWTRVRMAAAANATGLGDPNDRNVLGAILVGATPVRGTPVRGTTGRGTTGRGARTVAVPGTDLVAAAPMAVELVTTAPAAAAQETTFEILVALYHQRYFPPNPTLLTPGLVNHRLLDPLAQRRPGRELQTRPGRDPRPECAAAPLPTELLQSVASREFPERASDLALWQFGLQAVTRFAPSLSAETALKSHYTLATLNLLVRWVQTPDRQTPTEPARGRNPQKLVTQKPAMQKTAMQKTALQKAAAGRKTRSQSRSKKKPGAPPKTAKRTN
ncbi:hypothetical protein GNI_132540 [Gregarina niphandrodes]|uniref:Uncharacterized protein n=1 Tax=Gregarina niphandrodes TaxID=110365 RepID=A0A023B1M1_GRENI|nr:hypothetical protein GNI_132540 [Gregarina niphandrodes]EZG46947.1 hypothetical protein GNI_132540 [Gregarina niphandrodes]|eukprot:XP_011132222.1 hypothetical protein GNI_132540 [Gregarina niphandrodes]